MGHLLSLLYQVYVRSFADADGDGQGDLAGLSSKLDYLQNLGVDTLWLSPVHPSPNVDWGYDVADYNSIHPEYGTLAGYERLVEDARARDIGVWLDLVPNHTSDHHEWFEQRPEYYVWSKTIPNDWTSIFTGKSAWQWSDARGQYYLHQFAPHQPDLDWWNEDVRREFDDILRFWFDRGVRGLRIDVAHGLIKDEQLRDGQEYLRSRPEVHEIYARWQEVAREYDPKPTLMGETYVLPLPDLYPYWQHLDLIQNFAPMHLPLEVTALRPIVEDVMQHLPPNRRPVWFGSNHDHSRLATRWAGGDERKIRAALFLLLTLPGVAILYQGDELGLTDGKVPRKSVKDLAHPPRDPERTPMPWTKHGDEWRDPWLPLADTSRNVEDQLADPGSTYHYTRDLIAVRKLFADDSYETLESGKGIWAYRRGDKVCRVDFNTWDCEITD